MERIVKNALLKATEGGAGLAGMASVYGNMDRSWESDVIAPGAFASAIPGFLANGFVPDSHEWGSFANIAAYPTRMEDRPEGLYLEAAWHSTDAAQAVRAVAVERMANGLSVGLSVGFSMGSCEVYGSGAQMVGALEAQGRLTPAYDVDAIRAHEGSCRLILDVSELYEVSVVPVPANPKAIATAVKSKTSLSNELDVALAAVESATERLATVVRLRTAEGRNVASATRAKAADLAEALQRLAQVKAETRDVAIARARALALLAASEHERHPTQPAGASARGDQRS